jgi:hypothetical protein
MREVLERKMTGLLIGFRTGSKSVTDVLPTLNRLKKECPLIATEYEKKYISILSNRARNVN